MINSRQRELAARNKFSFTDPADEVAFKTWAEGMEGRYSNFGKPGAGAWSRRSYHKTDGEDESAVPSPKLWEQEEEKAEEKSVMAGYRKEMMELVKDVPDSAYELSLKDLVVDLPMTRKEEGKARKGLKKGVERRISRKESMEAGFLLRMSLPFSLGWKRRKNESSLEGSGGSKVSPKPVLGGREKSGSDGGRSSSNGSSNSNISTSSGSRKLCGCYSFFFPHKSRAMRM